MTDKGWIQTYTGKQFWPLEPREQDVDIIDIAHALSLICRFTGHVKEFYSVAQHSFWVSTLIPEEYALEGLMHDAAEAYLADIAQPVKKQLPEWRQYEEAILKVIFNKFNLLYPLPWRIELADKSMLLKERDDLMSRPPVLWTWYAGIESADIPKINGWAPGPAETMFLSRYNQLTKRRNN